MKALILVAGYAIRLYPLTKERPKPLLPVCGKPIMEYILEKLEKLDQIDEILVVTNHKFVDKFNGWLDSIKSEKEIRVIDDGTTSNDDKLGSIGDINFAIRAENLNCDLLVVAGDNLFSFELGSFLDFARTVKPSASIGVYDVGDTEAAKKYGILELDEAKRIVSFEEKPQSPATTLISICLYYFSKETLGLISEYLEAGNNPDAPGYYIDWLYQRVPTYGFVFCGSWYDIGDIASYHQASIDYEKGVEFEEQ